MIFGKVKVQTILSLVSSGFYTSLSQRFGVTESSDIVEMESSCSESEGDEDVEPPTLDSCVSSAPASPKVTKTKIPSPIPDNHHPPPPEVRMFLFNPPVLLISHSVVF